MTSQQLSPEPGNHMTRHRLWMKVLLWITGSVGLLLVLLVIGVFALLHNGRFHQYLLHKADQIASERLGTQVTLQNYSIHLSNLSVDLYGLTIDGSVPYSTPPLLQVQHIGLDFRIVSMWHRKWYFENISADNPVLRMFTNSNGISNLPHLKSTGNNHTNIFELGVRHASLHHGELYVNDKKISLDAELRDLDFSSAFDTVKQEYLGSLSYRDGKVQFGTFNSIPHSLEAQFKATSNNFSLTGAKIDSGSSQFEATATLSHYDDPTISAHYEAVLDGSLIRKILKEPSIPSGIVVTRGSVQYQHNSQSPFLESLTVEGSLTSAKLDVREKQLRAQARKVAAHYSLQNGNLIIRSAHANLLGGAADGDMIIHNLDGESHALLNVSLRGISMADAQQLLAPLAATKGVALRGALNGTVQAKWGRIVDDLLAQTTLSIRGNISNVHPQKPNTNALPISGVIHGAYSAANQQIKLTNSYLQMPQTSLTMNGTVSQRSNLAVHFKSDDLADLQALAGAFRPDINSSSSQLRLAGTASFDGIINGSASAPHIVGQLVASNLQIRGTQWRSFRARVEASPSLVNLQHGALMPEPHGSIDFSTSVVLHKWSFTKENPIQLELDASQLDIADLTKLVNSSLPVNGTLAANLHLHGTALNPIGNGSIALTKASVYEQPIHSANLKFSGSEGQLQGNLSAHLASGTVQSAFSFRPNQKSYTAKLSATGIALAKLELLQAHHIDANGTVNLNVSGEGLLSNPQFNATVQTSKLEISHQTIDGLTLQASVANHIATADLNSQAIHSSIQAHAKINLTGEYFADAALDTQSIPLQPLLATYAPAQAANLGGATQVRATLQGPLKDWKQLEIHATLPELKVNYGNSINLAAASPIHVDYTHGLIALQKASIRGTDTDLQIQGTIPTFGDRPIELLLVGTINLQLAQLFDPDYKSSGQLRFNINSYGARTDPNVEGEVDVVDASFYGGDLPLGLQHGNGVLTLTKNRLNIKTFKANSGGGTVIAQGGITFRPSIQFDLGLAANDIRMLYPQGVREELAGNIRLVGNTENAVLGGRVQIENLSFTPDFDLAGFTSQLSGGIAPPPSQGFAQNTRLNVAISSTNNLNLVSRTLSVDGTANLQIRGTIAQPVILGRVDLTNGDVIFNGNRFTLSGGTVQFVNPSETQPVVNLALNTTIQQYNIHLRFNGPVDQLRTNYTSDPSLPAADIINLLAFGETTEASAANPVTPTNQAAMGLVASQVSSQITSRVAKIAGISQLSINPVLAGGSIQGPAGAVVTIQQRVTGNLFVTFSTNVATTQNQVIMGQYNVSPRLAFSVTRDQNGGVAFDTLLKKKW
ncbi:MAG TPA: translocation/assembly module TamB domain-containing protein [Acidobacteriaceae bacterium]|nr:translocation/assembly module TamB domain-containing protein [Acidobacteriaceae bacterium]